VVGFVAAENASAEEVCVEVGVKMAISLTKI
jgi:hypothetical protein